MAEPKLHHYVPRFYLKGFADPERPQSVWVYEKGVDAPRSQGIANTAAESYYYSITTPAGEREHRLETKFLAPIESAATPIIERLRSEPRPTLGETDIQPLAAFLSAAYARSPFSRATSEKLFLGLAAASTSRTMRNAQAVQNFLDDNPDIPHSVDEIQRLASEIGDPSKWELRLRKDAAVAVQFLFVADIYPYFMNKHWSVLEASGDPEFISGDSPLSVFVLDPRGRALVGVGIGRPNAEIVLPISPLRALRLTHRPQRDRQRVAARVVSDINRRIVYQTQRYVYASRSSKSIGNFVSKWFAQRQELRLDPVAMAAYAGRFGRTH
jgi:hypothetical protein